MTSKFERQKLKELESKMASRKSKIDKERYKLGRNRFNKENIPSQEPIENDWADHSLNTTKSSTRSTRTTKSTATARAKADIPETSKEKKIRRTRSTGWEYSSSGSDSNRLVIDEDNDNNSDDSIANHVRENAEMRQKFEEMKEKIETNKKAEDEATKKELAKMKEAMEAKRKERLAKKQERLKKMEEEEAEANTTLTPSGVDEDEAEATIKSVVPNEEPSETTPDLSRKSRAKRASKNKTTDSNNPLDTSTISNFQPQILSTPKPSPMPSMQETVQGHGIQTSQTYHTEGTALSGGSTFTKPNTSQTFVKPKPNLSRSPSSTPSKSASSSLANPHISDETKVIVKSSEKTKIIQEAPSDKTKIVNKRRKRKSEEMEAENESLSFQLSDSNVDSTAKVFSENQTPNRNTNEINSHDSPVENSQFESIQSDLEVTASPKKDDSQKQQVEEPPSKSTSESEQEKSPIENKRVQSKKFRKQQSKKNKNISKTKKKSQLPENKEVQQKRQEAPKKKRRSSIRFTNKEQIHEIPSRYDQTEKDESDDDQHQADSTKMNDSTESPKQSSRRTSMASSAYTLNRRGSDAESEDETIVIDRRKGFKQRKGESAKQIWKQGFMRENIITPGTPEEGLRRSNRTRFKSELVTGTRSRITHLMLTDDMIKNNEFGFGAFTINTPANIEKTKPVKTARERDPSNKKKKKSNAKLNDTAAQFKNVDDDDLDNLLDPLTKELEFVQGDDIVRHEAFSLPEEQFYVDLNTGNKIKETNPTVFGKQILVKTIIKCGTITQGEMMFGASAEKADTNVGENTIIFTILYGGFEVIINKQTRLVYKGCTFTVLAENDYSIRNASGKRAELSFIMTSQNIRCEELNFTKAEEEVDSSEYSSEGEEFSKSKA